METNGRNGNGNGGNHPGMAVPVAQEKPPGDVGEAVAVVEVDAPVVFDHAAMAETAREFWRLKTALLTDADVQQSKGGAFVTASGYDKLGAALGLSEMVLGVEERFDDETGKLQFCKTHVRVTHERSGRAVEGIGYCTPKGSMKDPIHDSAATAHTRARKRAIDSFIGGVEPPAPKQPQRSTGTTRRPPSQPQQTRR